MTLSKVKVDLKKNFEQGMGYVACKYSVSGYWKKLLERMLMDAIVSRAKTLQGLKVVSFPQSAQLEANEEVKKFLRTKLKMDC